MFTTQLAIDLVFVALGTVLVVLVLSGVRRAVRALRRRDEATPTPAVSPAVVLVVALVALLGVHVLRTGPQPVEASDRYETVARPAAPTAAGEDRVGGPLSARIGTLMGRSTLDLRQASVGPGEEAIVTVFVAMGRVTLRVPDGWDVDATGLPAVGVVEDRRAPRQIVRERSRPVDRLAPRLVLRGLVVIGSVEIAS